MVKLSSVLPVLLSAVLTVSAQNSVQLWYNISKENAIKSCIQAFESVSFKYRFSNDSSEMHVFYPPANKVYASLLFGNREEGKTTLKISSFYVKKSDETKERENGFFYKIATQVADQGILGSDSRFAKSKFKTKNQGLYTGLCLVSPSIGMFYYLSSPINKKSSKYVLSTLLLGLDALGFYGIFNGNVGINYGSGRKSKTVGTVSGALLLGGMRINVQHLLMHKALML